MYLFLYIFWIVLNGKITLEICLVGLVLTVLIALLMKACFGYTPAREKLFLKKAPVFILYVFVLLREIMKASAAMIGYIFRTKKTVDPVLITFNPKLKTGMGRFILANSITLTPGTISVDVHDDTFTVHCLSRGALDVSDEGVFLRWIRKLEA